MILKIIKEEGNLLKHVYLTNAHYDHVGAVKKIVDHYNIPYYIHSADLKLLKRASLYSISMENRDIPFSDNYKFYDTNLSSHHHLFNTTTNTLTDISNDRIAFSSLPDIPSHLEIEQTEVLIKVKNKQSS